jgi:hypothetical protein
MLLPGVKAGIANLSPARDSPKMSLGDGKEKFWFSNEKDTLVQKK